MLQYSDMKMYLIPGPLIPTCLLQCIPTCLEFQWPLPVNCEMWYNLHILLFCIGPRWGWPPFEVTYSSDLSQSWKKERKTVVKFCFLLLNAVAKWRAPDFLSTGRVLSSQWYLPLSLTKWNWMQSDVTRASFCYNVK